jgi:hypothetical protein
VPTILTLGGEAYRYGGQQLPQNEMVTSGDIGSHHEGQGSSHGEQQGPGDIWIM